MCHAMISQVLTGINDPLQLVQRSAHRLRVSEDVNKHSQWSEANKGQASVTC
jgi:hypothetical protein